MNLNIINDGGVNSISNDNGVVFHNDSKNTAKNDGFKNDYSYTEADVKDAVSKLNKELKTENSHAEYSYYEKLNTITVKIINDETDEVIMELPPEKILDLISKMCELNGVIVDKDA